MRTLRSVDEVRSPLDPLRRAGETIGLVPTMGAFHEGHLSLMRRARSECDVVVVSLFVNPTQFNESTDLAAYPRDEERDAAQAAQIGVDYLFAPAVEEIYPEGFSTTVSVAGVTEVLEGSSRGPAHFDAVATVVTKLLNIVGPDVAYFGQKDAQQAVVIKRLVRDLNIPVHVEICPTVRESDGLAMSSRNVRLSVDERTRALGLNRALAAASDVVARGELDADAVVAAARQQLADADLEPEYLELVSAENLTPVRAIEGDVLAVIAARVGDIRLIDNQIIRADRSTNGRPASNGRH